MTKEEAIQKLSRSKFRSRFKLNAGDCAYISEKGMGTIRRHAADFVAKKLAPANPENDGRQTPMRGHSVFKAMHGCAMCCRGCMEKWWNVKRGVPLAQEQQDRIVEFLMYWIAEGVKRNGARQ